MTAVYQRNPRWTAYPDPENSDHVIQRGQRARVRWIGVPTVVGALVLGISAGSAYAYFKGASGSGTGHATTGTTVAITVNAVTGTADLLPGGTGTASFKLQNGNSFGATYTSVRNESVSSSNSSACPSSNIIVPSTPYSISSVAVNANSTSGTQTIPVTLSASAPNGCQGITFTITLTLSGQSS